MCEKHLETMGKQCEKTVNAESFREASCIIADAVTSPGFLKAMLFKDRHVESNSKHVQNSKSNNNNNNKEAAAAASASAAEAAAAAAVAVI